MTFHDTHRQYDWDQVRESIASKTEADVTRALASGRPTLEDFKALVSPAAQGRLEEMAALSQRLTQQRFGRTIRFYLPLYLSNQCTNACVYCGFSSQNQMQRVTLTPEQALAEAQAIRAMGFGQILLVTGEHPRACGFGYLQEIIRLIRPLFPSIAAEVAPMSAQEYRTLIGQGLHTVYIYQETYNPTTYATLHPGGPKADFGFRLQTPDRLGAAGIYRLGLGSLLGLDDWRADAFFTALHLQYLQKHYWKTKYSISFPRLRPHAGAYSPAYPVSDRQLLQLICAYRIFDQDVEMSLSTRESPKFRDHAFRLGVTAMSAGSKTEPGGYAQAASTLEQFAVHDDRPPHVVRDMVRAHGYEVVWKDWDMSIHANTH